jgi:hypothetical protein
MGDRARVMIVAVAWLAIAIAGGTAAAPPVRQKSSEITVTVDARHAWVDSGLVVEKDRRFEFKADGSIRWGSQPDQVAGPDGRNAKPGKIGPGGLIGRVGYTGKPFAIGSARTVTMAKGGKLFLGINDFIFGDNAGTFTVIIRAIG